MAKVRMTDLSVKKLKCPEGRIQAEFWDLSLPGFGLRVTDKGTKTFVVMTRVLDSGKWKQSRISLGRYPVLSLGEARQHARKAQEMASGGEDPRANRLAHKRRIEEESRKNFGQLREKFLKLHCKVKLKPKTYYGYEKTLFGKELVAWEKRPLSQIKRRDIIELLDQIVADGHPIKANRYFDILRSMFNWAASRDLIEDVPTDRVVKPAQESKRDRALSLEEVKLFWEACASLEDFEPLFKILLLTGQRRSEVAEMRWSELHDLNSPSPMWVLPKERTKMSRAHKVPLSSTAADILRAIIPVSEEFVFSTTGTTPVSGFTRAKRRLDKRIAELIEKNCLNHLFVEPWRIHDLRRTAATHMAEMGFSRDVVELVLNHQSGTRSGVAGIYNRSELLDQRRKALQALASRITS